jgi:hypothetical protein
MKILQHVEPFIGNGSVNTFPAVKDTHATIEALLETGFPTPSLPRCYMQGKMLRDTR